MVFVRLSIGIELCEGLWLLYVEKIIFLFIFELYNIFSIVY